MKKTKRLLSTLIAVAMLLTITATPAVISADESSDFADLTAHELVAQMKTGWNLGNTFDAHNNTHVAGYGLTQNILALETNWIGGTSGGNQTTDTLIKAVKEAGFDTIRIPVTWYKVVNPATWEIRAEWMTRVKEVVDWAIEEGLFVILNSHHDDDFLLLNIGDASDSSHEGNAFVTGIWEQIAETFKDYDEKLIFEGLNEPRTRAAIGGTNEWGGGTAAERENLNRLNQAFVDTVRATGGNNEHRILMVPTYGASANPNALSGYQVPDDSEYNEGVNKIIMSVHTYSPFGWAHDGNGDYGGKPTIIGDLNRVEERAEMLGIPVILGEWGSVTRSQPASDRARHADDYVTAARERGMVTVWWDNSGDFGIINRKHPHATNDSIINGIMRGLGGNLVNTDESDIVKGDWFLAGMENGEFTVKGLYHEWCKLYGKNYSDVGVYGYELQISPARNADTGVIKFETEFGIHSKSYEFDITEADFDRENTIISYLGNTNLLTSENVKFTVKAAEGGTANFNVVSLIFLGENGEKLSIEPVYYFERALTSRIINYDFEGKVYGWDVEVWSQDEPGVGPVSMTVRENGTFSCEWDTTFNSLFRSGKKFERKTQTIDDIGKITLRYTATHSSNNTSYLGAYGWFEGGGEQNPLIEWYIVDNWHDSYRPGGPSVGVARDGSEFLGTVETDDGSVYDIYKTQRVDAPSIDGTKTFTQIFSVRHEKRLSGTIDVSTHFKAWAQKGLDMSGYLYEVSLNVEGFGGSAKSSGEANITGIYLKYGDNVMCSHPIGKTGNTCDWCRPPKPELPEFPRWCTCKQVPCICDTWCTCNQDPCVCPTYVAEIEGKGSWSDQRHVTGDSVSPKSNSINPELIKYIRVTFDIPNHACGEKDAPPEQPCGGRDCLQFALMGGGTGWEDFKFCYKENRYRTVDLESIKWDYTSGWLMVSVASWATGNDGRALVEVLDENGRALQWGQEDPYEDCNCNRASCDTCSDNGFWRALGDVDGDEEGIISIFDALEILKYLVNMSGAIVQQNGSVNSSAMKAAIISDQGLNETPPKPTIFCALEILKRLVNMESYVDGVHIDGTRWND